MSAATNSQRARASLYRASFSPRPRRAGALVAAALCLPACSGEKGGAAPGPDSTAPDAAFGHCMYENRITGTPECKDYLGSGWEEQIAQQDCAEQNGQFTGGSSCSYEEMLGRCVLNEGTEDAYQLVFPGSDVDQCALFQRGCEVFARGKFIPDARCEGVGEPSVPAGGQVFLPPTLECREPLQGEPPGQSDGEVCTWSAISACTEPGRKFEDYGSCDTVITQRPYYAAPPAEVQTAPDDPRLADPVYMAEVAWVREQVEACACVCCHSNRIAPNGAANWFIEAEPIWTDTFRPRGLALGAGWLDSTVLGAYPAEENNGFDRTLAGVPSTDPERMKRFFENELTRRGYTREDLADEPPFGGFLVDQLNYTPETCKNGEGVGEDGRLTWRGGAARYIYVLEEGSDNPLVPPNLDLPEGTLWRLDVAPQAKPIQSGIAYGSTPEGTTQRMPDSGSPKALVAGSTYYLYVLADIGLPLTRCLFTYPGI